MRDCVSLNGWRNTRKNWLHEKHIFVIQIKIHKHTARNLTEKTWKSTVGGHPGKVWLAPESWQCKAGEAILSSVTKPHPCGDKWANIFCQILHQNPRKKVACTGGPCMVRPNRPFALRLYCAVAKRLSGCSVWGGVWLWIETIWKWWFVATALKPNRSIQWPDGFSRRAGGAPASIQSLFSSLLTVWRFENHDVSVAQCYLNLLKTR